MNRAVLPFLLLAAAPAAADTVSGTVRYENRIYDDNGFTGATEFLPVRLADIEVVRSSDGVVLGSGETTGTGTYSIAVPNGGVQSIFLRVYARQDNGLVNSVVMNNPATLLIYTASSTAAAVDTDSPVTINLDVTIASGGAPPFNVFDCSVFSWQYMATLDSPLASPLPQLRFYWTSGTSNGTYYNPTENAIYLLGRSSDPDEYDDDLILHEAGHFMSFNFSKDNSPGGVHTIIDQLDARLSWSEGWAHFWSAAVRRYAETLFPGRYNPVSQVDNFGSGNSLWNLELPSFSSQTIMATNEAAVAAALWDITDTPSDGAFDTLSGMELEIWLVFDDDIPLRSQITLEDFTAGWATRVSAANFAATTGSAAADGIFKARSIRYYADPTEPNNSFGAAVAVAIPSTTTQRTLYTAADEDWFSVTLAPGIVQAETLNLGDGADTLLRLYDTDGLTVLAESDDRTAADPSSLVQYSIASAGTYFLRVTAFSGAGAVTEHGYYDLAVANIVNFPPAISSATVTTSSGAAPLRIGFDGAASDPDGSIARYEWDFDGDGRYDHESLDGASAVHTYSRVGTFSATLRVTDNGGSTATRAVTVSVAADVASPSISIEETAVSGTAPTTVTFTAAITGIVPVSWEWDFQNDGIPDATSVVGPDASYTYREGGGFFARLTVHDRTGRAWRADGRSITISPGSLPPSITSFSAAPSTGTVPLQTTFSVVAVDAGGFITKIEWDPDGDGSYDIETTPPTVSVLHTVQRTGRFNARVRVTDDSGLIATRSLSDGAGPMTTDFSTGVAGWLIDPRAGDRLAGRAVTLTAEAIPAALFKKVQFQYRIDSPPGPWIDIGAPVFSTGSIYSASWDVSGFAALSTFDLRVLVNDAVSGGDNANTVQIDSSSPDVSEESSAKLRRVSVLRRTLLTRPGGERVTFPYGSATSASSFVVRLEPAATPDASGSTLGMAPIGTAMRISLESGSTGFQNSFLVRLPYSAAFDDPGNLEIHWFDASTATWRRDFFSVVDRSSRTVEVRAHAFGIYSLFRSFTGAGRHHGGGCSGAGDAAGPDAGFLVLLLILLTCRRFSFWSRPR